MGREDYLTFLFDIAEISISFNELEKAQRLLRLLVVKYVRSTSKPLKAKAHERLGNVAFYQNNFRMARNEYRKSLQLYTLLNDTVGIARTQNASGVVLVEQGRPSRGELLFKEARILAKGEGSDELLAKIEMNLGNAYTMRGLWDQAMTSYQDALKALGSKQNEDTKARILHDIGIFRRESYSSRSSLNQ